MNRNLQSMIYGSIKNRKCVNLKKEKYRHNAASDRIMECGTVQRESNRDPFFHIVLVEPEIPANTGNISRTCALTGTKLHLIEPLGFSIDDRMLKRAGLDYWDHLDIEVHPDLEHFLEKYGEETLFFATTHGSVNYTTVNYEPGSFLIFGRETAGLPRELINAHPDSAIRIPMGSDPALRSLNLSNSVAIVLYEALRQNGFPELV